MPVLDTILDAGVNQSHPFEPAAGMDIVEVAPAYDVGEITALAASQLAMEMLYLYANRPGT